MASIIFCAPAFAEEQLSVWHIRNWSGALVVDTSGNFERCNAATSYDDGLSLGFAINADGNITVRLTNDKWSFEKGEPIVFRFTVGSGSGEIRGVAITTYQVIFTMPAGDRFLSAIRKSYNLKLYNEDLGEWNLDLKNSSPAIQHMATCALSVAEKMGRPVEDDDAGMPPAPASHTPRQTAINVDGRSISALGADRASLTSAAMTMKKIDY
jgi:hypothetical protein